MVAIYLVVLLIVTAYILFGALHMVAPRATFPIYRRFLGRDRFNQYAESFQAVRKSTWKFLGAFYIVFALLVLYILMRATHTF